jgi:hypothetical protein
MNGKVKRWLQWLEVAMLLLLSALLLFSLWLILPG